MLPRKQRIRKALSQEVFSRGASVVSAHFLLKTEPIFATSPTSINDGKVDTGTITRTATETATEVGPRFAVSISKKVAPTAVLRNRTRRRVYSVLRDFVPKVKRNSLVAISVKKGGEKLPYEAIVLEIENLLKKAGLLVG